MSGYPKQEPGVPVERKSEPGAQPPTAQPPTVQYMAGQYSPGQYPAGQYAPGQQPPQGMVMVPAQPGQPADPGQVVITQPGGPVQAVVAMPPPPSIPGCPPGLEYLAQLDQLLVHQLFEIALVVTNIEFENKYRIKNSLGQQVFFAKEETGECNRICCGPKRGFVMHITDNFNQEVIKMTRPFKCCAGYSWCACTGSHCSHFIEVESPPGTVIGYIRQDCHFASPHFVVENSDGKTLLKIQGPCCRCQTVSCQDDINFWIMSADLQHQLGRVSKQWGGWLRETYTQATNFGVEFPADMDLRTKALLLASTFLIDFMFFEKNN